MSYLIDTNVLSELRRKNPDAGVVAWFSQRPAVTLYLSVLTLGEIRKGIEGLIDETQKMAMLDWLEADLPAFFTGRILPVDAQVADRWGRLVAAAGRPVPAIDSLLAATALEHDLMLVTRNVKDFSDMPVQTIEYVGSDSIYVLDSQNGSSSSLFRQRCSAAYHSAGQQS